MHWELSLFCRILSDRFNRISAVVLFAMFFPGTAFSGTTSAGPGTRDTKIFDETWRFHLGDLQNGQNPALDDSQWRLLDLSHDWSIEGEISQDNPSGDGGGALPGSIGWYRKTFNLPVADKDRSKFAQEKT
jgi:beta-galactosidase